jgi:negative regulator of sigma E activity
VLEIVAGAALGALATLLVTWWLNRNNASRTARRESYLNLLTMLKAALRVQESAIFDHNTPIPDIISNERIDEFNARLEIDASPQVRELVRESFRLVSRFNVSHVMRVPIEVDEHGLYRHRFDLVREVDGEVASLQMASVAASNPSTR